MQFDLSAVETGTMVVIGTLVFALLIGLFMMVSAFAAMVLVGVGRLTWYLVAGVVVGMVHAINHGWDRLVHHASTVDLPGDFQVDFGTDFRAEYPGQAAPSTGTYPRVVLRDS
ncbi:hypothetical protein SAMN04487914_12829 [Arthrobacter sp. ok909]|jgi:branched-subunit amino acid ABC-type transport system permease component|uniref:hypothetical protein n=1 Tax=Arthrobacter sp. ok909 TaxID=1761746 RepID=UPI00088A46A6|nr:hypothetical protein [Arthrobacter sp. ok909]SDP70239.1 hypothetical protein SAMN04487914_12829 [Arthrobacter sp. ok909]